eukprot:1758769-Rhodomonas_salina.1
MGYLSTMIACQALYSENEQSAETCSRGWMWQELAATPGDDDAYSSRRNTYLYLVLMSVEGIALDLVTCLTRWPRVEVAHTHTC